MRPRFALTVVLCLLAGFASLPATAEETTHEEGRARFEAQSFWNGIVSWVLGYGLTIDPNGLVPLPGGTGNSEGGALFFDAPSYDLTIDPNG